MEIRLLQSAPLECPEQHIARTNLNDWCVVAVCVGLNGCLKLNEVLEPCVTMDVFDKDAELQRTRNFVQTAWDMLKSSNGESELPEMQRWVAETRHAIMTLLVHYCLNLWWRFCVQALEGWQDRKEALDQLRIDRERQKKVNEDEYTARKCQEAFDEVLARVVF